MILRLSYSTINLWVPLETFCDKPQFSWTSYFFFIILAILMLFCAYFIFVLIDVMWKIPKFHTNNRIILSVLITSWYTCSIGYLLLLPYQYNIIELEVSDSSTVGFETHSRVVVDITFQTIPLLIGSILIWTYFSTVISTLLLFLAERAIATYLYSDYERKPRPTLTLVIIVILPTLIFFETFLLTTYIVNMKSSFVISILMVIIFIPSFLFLKKHNNELRKTLKMGQNNVPDPLAAKFQTEENIRSLSLATHFVYCAIFINIIFLLVLISNLFGIIDSKTAFVLFQIICLLNPLVVVPATLSSVVEWKNAFIRNVPFIPRSFRSKKVYVQTENAERITGVYFQQLQHTWNRQS
ncbi:unnamed protein product [Caenorhabditis angaria]|uniref:Uncharacterized protein n=1 Tax=Caenorhabditis angaria TaxID=860376 RepID=A0A9P1N9J6_9PELO|nr:unnamed protein product [Caenorhabditis angaria]